MNLMAYREKNHLTQADVANKIGITQQRYSRYERGEREADYVTLIKIADFFNVTIDELLGRTTAPQLFDNARVERPEIIELFYELTPQQQQNLLNYARGMAVSNQLADNVSTKKKRA